MINSHSIQGCIYERRFLEPVHKIQFNWHASENSFLFSLIKSKLDPTMFCTFGILKTVCILSLLLLFLWRMLTNAHQMCCSRIPFLQRKQFLVMMEKDLGMFHNGYPFFSARYMSKYFTDPHIKNVVKFLERTPIEEWDPRQKQPSGCVHFYISSCFVSRNLSLLEIYQTFRCSC